jgi:hypothetical protein
MACLRLRLLCALGAATLLGGGCASSAPEGADDAGTSDGAAGCDAAGVLITIFGKAKQDLVTNQATTLKVVLTKRGEGHIAGAYVPGHLVSFSVSGAAPADFVLSSPTAESDSNGIAEVEVHAGETPSSSVQVTATTGSCNLTFSLTIRRPTRRVEFVGADPRAASTGARISLTAVATTDGSAVLSGELVTVSLESGQTGGMRLSTIDGGQQGASVQLRTGSDGRATVRLDTGAEAAHAQVRVDMPGTGGDVLTLDIIPKSLGGGCVGDFDCPTGQVCHDTVCVDPDAAECQGPGECQSPAQCIAGTCVEPDPQGTPCTCHISVNSCSCAGNQVCIAGYCTLPPGICENNDQCPLGWECQEGTCEPGQNPCDEENRCPTGMVCQSGQCQPADPSECAIPGRPQQRLQGTWAVESTLHLHDAVNPIFDGFLTAGGILQDIINGTFRIEGVPPWISVVLDGLVRQLLAEFLPRWGYELIQALADLHQILNDMRVWSTVRVTNARPDVYRASERWDLVGFRFRGQDIISAPEATEVGTVDIDNYVVREVCGVFYADQHRVHNAVGGLVGWAVDVALTAVTCLGDGPCYTSIEDALTAAIDCSGLGAGVNELVQDLFEGAPDVSGPITAACTLLKRGLIQQTVRTLDNIKVRLALMTLRGQAAVGADAAHIPEPQSLGSGHWYGTLAGGNFRGEFTARRQ